jgi:NIPSNAP
MTSRREMTMNALASKLMERGFAAVFVAGMLSVLCVTTLTSGRTDQPRNSERMQSVKHLTDFPVIEFRRYTIREGERQHFAQYFESYFPEAFEQLGAIALGHFFERNNQVAFTWMRAFHSMDDRAKINALFYYGPLWREHARTLNTLMVDSDNVLLLRPLSPERGVNVLPAVDPVTEPNGAQGVVVAEIFAIKPNAVESFARAAEATFADYRNAGMREAGVLVTLDAQNNFPQLPIRTDGSYLVWLGIASDDKKRETAFAPLVERSSKSLFATDLLRAEPEIVILDPTKRSRLRWIADDLK